MNTVKILVHKELATTFNSWSIYIGYTLFFCVCGFFSWLSSNNLLYIGQANMMQVFGIINWTQFFLIPAPTIENYPLHHKPYLHKQSLYYRSQFVSLLNFPL